MIVIEREGDMKPLDTSHSFPGRIILSMVNYISVFIPLYLLIKVMDNP